MSKEDRARAESGLLFRSGSLVPAESVPGTLQYNAKQAKVDEEIRMMRSLEDKGIVVAKSPIVKRPRRRK